MTQSILSLYADRKQGEVVLRHCGILYEEHCDWTPEMTQASGIVPLLQRVIQSVPNYHEPGVIIAPRGPSSFTTLRITLAVAKAIHFCIPHAEIFAPSNFLVLSFSAKAQLFRNQNFLVLIDAFKMGFYGAVFCWKETSAIPEMVSVPAFYTPEEGQDFLRANKTEQIVTDFSDQSFGYRFLNGAISKTLIVPKNNFAMSQIQLYDSDNHRDQADDREFSPLYLHMPLYAKTEHPSVL